MVLVYNLVLCSFVLVFIVFILLFIVWCFVFILVYGWIFIVGVVL